MIFGKNVHEVRLLMEWIDVVHETLPEPISAALNDKTNRQKDRLGLCETPFHCAVFPAKSVYET